MDLTNYALRPGPSVLAAGQIGSRASHSALVRRCTLYFCSLRFCSTIIHYLLLQAQLQHLPYSRYPIYAPYIKRTSKFPPFGRISVMQNSILGPPMVYITHISSKYSIFKTLRVNGSIDTCLILTSIKYSQVFVLILSVNTREFSRIFAKYIRGECEYRITCAHKYLYLRICTVSIPCLSLPSRQSIFLVFLSSSIT